MSETWVKISKTIAEKKKEMFDRIVEQLCSNSLLVILFGSRAKGLETPLSDYDLLVVKRDGAEEGLIIQWPAQIFQYSLESVNNEIRKLNTIILDAVTEGKLLCGDTFLFHQLRRQAEEMVKTRHVSRGSLGWVPDQLKREDE